MITTNQEKQLYEYGGFVAKRFYRFYNSTFRALSMDLDDLKQESNITVFQVLEKYKDRDFDKLKKIVGASVGNRLMVLKRECKGADLKIELIDDIKTKFGGENNEGVDYSWEEYYLDKNLEKESSLNIIIKNMEEDGEVLLRDIEDICSPLEVELIKKYYLENKSLREVVKEMKLNISHELLRNKVFPHIIRKLKRKLKREINT